MIITREMFIEFAMAQKPERPLDFDESATIHKCGCPMVHIGQYLNLDFDRCSSRSWLNGSKYIASVDQWSFHSWGVNHKNYGELQEAIKQSDHYGL